MELSRRQPSPLSLLQGGASFISLVNEFFQTEMGSQILDTLVRGVRASNDISTLSSSGVQARIDPISIDGLGTELVEKIRNKETTTGS